jgi:predicted RNA methylase
MEISDSQKAFKNFKFGSEYYKGENVNTPKIMSAVKKVTVGENPQIMLDVGCGCGMYSKIFP